MKDLEKQPERAEPALDNPRILEADTQQQDVENDTESGDETIAAATPPPIDSGDDMLGKVLGGVYVIESLLGSGAVSTVFKARHLVLNHIVAIKVLRRENLHGEKTMQRFVQEAKATVALNHANVVPSREFGIAEDGYPYIVMDFVEGESLAKILHREGKLEPSRAVNLISQICSGLAYTHKHGVIHRDIKPSNIMICKSSDGSETARLVDFGIAKQTDAEGTDLTQTGDVFGTPLYMSPEQCCGKKIDSRSDIYSLGCVLYELLSGRPPYQADSILETMMMHINAPGPTFEKGFPEWLEDPIARALEPNMDKRYQNIEQFQQEIEAASPQAKRKHRIRLSKRMRDWLIVGTLIIGIAGFGYIKITPLVTAHHIDTAINKWSQSKWTQSKQSFQSLLQEVEVCPVSNNAKASMLFRLGIRCKVAARDTSEIGIAEAMTCFFQALKYAESIDDRGALQKQLGDCYHLLSRYQEAEPLYQSAVQLRRQLAASQSEHLVNALNAQAMNLYAEKKFDQARTAANEALTIAGGHDALRQIQCLAILGRISEGQGNMQEAQQFYSRTVEKEAKMPVFDKWGVSSMLHDISILQQMGKQSEAEKVQALLDSAAYKDDQD